MTLEEIILYPLTHRMVTERDYATLQATIAEAAKQASVARYELAATTIKAKRSHKRKDAVK